MSDPIPRLGYDIPGRYDAPGIHIEPGINYEAAVVLGGIDAYFSALALHAKSDCRCRTEHCAHCPKQLWPCATVRALAPMADPDPHPTSDEETTT
jgi:hypothetical protein